MKPLIFLCLVTMGLTSSVVLHGMFGFGKSRRTPIGDIVNVLSGLLVVSLFLWAFASLDWYWPFLAVVVGFVVARLALSNFSGLHPWISRSPAMDVVTAIGAVFLWTAYWPY